MFRDASQTDESQSNQTVTKRDGLFDVENV